MSTELLAPKSRWQLRAFQASFTRRQISRRSKNMGWMLRLWLIATITPPSYNYRRTDLALRHPDNRVITLTLALYLRLTKASQVPIWSRGLESWTVTPEMRSLWHRGEARATSTMVAAPQHLRPLDRSILIEVQHRTLFYLWEATSRTPPRVSSKTTLTRKDVNSWSRIPISNSS